MENKKDKYIIAITTLSLLTIIFLMTTIIGIIIINNLNNIIDMHKNTIGTCNIDLEQVQKENESLRKRLEK